MPHWALTLWTAVVLTLIVGAVILGGIRRIASVNEKLVPFMAVFYVIVAVIALILNIDKVPAAFALIFQEAFNFQAAAGRRCRLWYYGCHALWVCPRRIFQRSRFRECTNRSCRFQ